MGNSHVEALKQKHSMFQGSQFHSMLGPYLPYQCRAKRQLPCEQLPQNYAKRVHVCNGDAGESIYRTKSVYPISAANA